MELPHYLAWLCETPPDVQCDRRQWVANELLALDDASTPRIEFRVAHACRNELGDAATSGLPDRQLHYLMSR
eukprot:4284847-Pyramimonas_sp.AAC.1